MLAEIGLDAATIVPNRRPLVRNCLDWTERKFHHSGVLATALFDHFMAEAWLERTATARALRVTAKGLALFQTKLHLDMTPFQSKALDDPKLDTAIG